MSTEVSAEVQAKGGVLAQFVEGFFSPIGAALCDPSVSEVLVNGPSEIFVERGGRLEKTELCFDSQAQLERALRAVAQFLGRELSEKSPILEGRLPDGSRLQAILSPLSAGGPCVAIRRHKKESLSIGRLVELGSMTLVEKALLERLVHHKKNILVSGGTGSGKTSLLRCVASLIPTEERIVMIEDARELQLSHPHVVSLEARPADVRGRGAVSIGDLFVATLRLRPDRIVIGELRGGEALDLIQAMTSGHGGCLSTVHASSPLDALRRLETMALYRGVDLPLVALRSQIASAVDVIVQIERCSDGRRQLKSIAQVRPLDETGGYQVKKLTERTEGPVQMKEGARNGG
jgi:pilus assembly protein CpaF